MYYLIIMCKYNYRMSRIDYVYMTETLTMIKSVMYILIDQVKIVAERKPYGYEQGD